MNYGHLKDEILFPRFFNIVNVMHGNPVKLAHILTRFNIVARKFEHMRTEAKKQRVSRFVFYHCHFLLLLTFNIIWGKSTVNTFRPRYNEVCFFNLFCIDFIIIQS